MIGRIRNWMLERKIARLQVRLTRDEALAIAREKIAYHDAAETLDLKSLSRGDHGILWMFQTDPHRGLVTVSVDDETGNVLVLDSGIMIQRSPPD